MKVSGISLDDRFPSSIPARLLFCWTKYSSGDSSLDGWRYGAVKPPAATCGWFAAALGRETILIAGSKTFQSPERAVDWLREAG